MTELQVLYEDNHVLVAFKPQNVLSQQDSTGDEDMVTIAKNYLKTKYDKPGNVYLGLVHRLDRPTSGVMVFAKTSKAAERLSSDLKNGDVEKEYLTIVHGVFEEKSGQLVNYLKKNALNNVVYVVPEATIGAKKAILTYDVIDEVNDHSLVKVNLITGRGHQIRVQMSHHGHVISGDSKYGSTDRCKLALWAFSLKFTHPTTKKIMRFISFPDDVAPWKAFDIEKHFHFK